jgi:hypothetical protein
LCKRERSTAAKRESARRPMWMPGILQALERKNRPESYGCPGSVRGAADVVFFARHGPA